MLNLSEIELQMEIKALRSENEKLKKEFDQYKKVILDNDLQDELEDLSAMSPEEQICVDGIKHLAELFKNGTFDKNDASNYDILHKNLRLIRGLNTESRKKKVKFDINEALTIVNGQKK